MEYAFFKQLSELLFCLITSSISSVDLYEWNVLPLVECINDIIFCRSNLGSLDIKRGIMPRNLVHQLQRKLTKSERMWSVSSVLMLIQIPMFKSWKEWNYVLAIVAMSKFWLTYRFNLSTGFEVCRRFVLGLPLLLPRCLLMAMVIVLMCWVCRY